MDAQSDRNGRAQRQHEQIDQMAGIAVADWDDNSPTMLIFDLIAEQRIAEAIERGEFDNLPGAGQPLDLLEEPLVPEELRLAHRILKNAGFVPQALETRREVRELEDLLDALDAQGETAAGVVRKLALLRLSLAESGRGRTLQAQCEYFQHIVQRLG